MKKVITVLFFVLCLFMLTSCTKGNNKTEMLNESENVQEISRFDEILNFIENKDNESMKAIFSQTACEEDEDLDNEIKYLFDFFQGEVISYIDSGAGESETIEEGIKTKTIRSFYEVETDVESYLVFLIEITEDTSNLENLGVYSLRVIKAVDEDTQFTSWQDMVIPGIYKPEE